MRLVSEHRSEGTRRDTERVVRLYTSGIREVFHGGSESWWRYIIIPRRLVLNEIRRLRKQGCKIVGYWNFWELLPEGASELIRSERYSGPGGAYVNRPFKIKSSRKFIVIQQGGGLDI